MIPYSQPLTNLAAAQPLLLPSQVEQQELMFSQLRNWGKDTLNKVRSTDLAQKLGFSPEELMNLQQREALAAMNSDAHELMFLMDVGAIYPSELSEAELQMLYFSALTDAWDRAKVKAG